MSDAYFNEEKIAFTRLQFMEIYVYFKSSFCSALFMIVFRMWEVWGIQRWIYGMKEFRIYFSNTIELVAAESVTKKEFIAKIMERKAYIILQMFIYVVSNFFCCIWYILWCN